MTEPLEVDAFAIDIETLHIANKFPVGSPSHESEVKLARLYIVEKVIKNLALDDKKRFEEYQDQNR